MSPGVPWGDEIHIFPSLWQLSHVKYAQAPSVSYYSQSSGSSTGPKQHQLRTANPMDARATAQQHTRTNHAPQHNHTKPSQSSDGDLLHEAHQVAP
jgi:hypothetical protein